MQENALFEGSFLNQPSIATRLRNEFAEATREFSENPSGYIQSAFKGDGIGGQRRKTLLRFGLAISVLVFSSMLLMIIIMDSFGATEAKASGTMEVLTLVSPDDFKPQQVEAPKADKKAGGGGGGGRNKPTPASQGQVPKYSLTPPIMAPTTRPTPRPPTLPMPETVQVDPRLQPPRDNLMPTGLPTGVPGPPSDGPGLGGGIGSGKGGGVGSGDGTGVGPGRGFNTGGGDGRVGGGDNNDANGPVDTKPQLVYKTQPQYTEEARKNKIQGSVVVRVLVGADGNVKQVRVTRGLPDGLTETAIQAAYKLRFRPATRNGQPVATWLPVAIEFTIR